MTGTTPRGAYTQSALTSVSGHPGNPGVYQVTVPASGSHEVHLGAEFATGLVRWGDLTHLTIVASLVSSNFTGHDCFIGLANALSDGGLDNNAVGLWFSKATSNNWLLRHKSGGVDDATDTGVAMTTDEFVVLKLKRISTTQVQVTVNGGSPITLTNDVDAPASGVLLNLGAVTAAGGSATLTRNIDRIYCRWATPSRQTT